MRPIESLTDQHRRLLVHIYASLREHIADEVAYDRKPDFPPLDPDTETLLWQEIYGQLSRLMVVAHAEEAVRVQQEIDDDTVSPQHRMAQ
jgi:hypothetical protein